ncbi:hypothetical protein IVB40_21715 [Bradyrhizobium sp. 40]|uniref:hypothetical protein n=1 Tax=unclassified Bradyrhizobium TaxID=2631580 RepID=UPI001FF7BF37|nr:MULTISPECIES: hypothetical protein [unclassified Bradyrhizobium]MCK1401484.1 hypothetical protein [Bradyrhizobium sp. 39]MCK1750638.1 hypothetical protein [Bradyrhizobium sp. 135]UPJ37930.1 hypothetical protein IVB45_14355 [Bradyrhizobium sp. 4]UPJ39948.1 hypothetical protein IVB40_21715 [Bradyrhizobium sp. 40]
MDENIVCEVAPDTRLVDRRRAAAYVGVTAGRFEQLVRDSVVPPPVMVDNKRRWPLALLDVAKDAVVTSSMPSLPQVMVEIAQDARLCERAPAPASHELPDQAWFEQRARFVQRVRRSLLSGNEIRLLREFKLLRQNQISMFGYYGSFEALMVRGYIVELARKPPSSRPLVTYRLTAQGERVLSALKDEPAI